MMKLRAILAGLFGALIFSESAFALSCMRPDVLRSLQEAKEGASTYYILVGRFASEGNRHRTNPNGYVDSEDPFKPKQPVITRSLFEGVSLAKHRRQDQALSRYPIDIETSCVASWCSRVPESGQDLIAFVLERPGQSPLLQISPCPSNSFQADAEKVQKLRQCLDKRCEPEERNGAFTR